jgi:hypothetical protein
MTPVATNNNNSNNNNNNANDLMAQTGYNIENGLFDKHTLSSLGYRSPLHRFFLVINIAAGLSGVNNIAAQLIALTFSGNPPMEVVLRLYMIGLFAIVVLNEAELTPMIRESKILTHWVTRGLFYTFLGVLSAVQYDVGVDNRFKNRGYSNNYNSGYNNNNNSNNNNNNNSNNGLYSPMMPTGEDFGEWYIFLVSWIMCFMGVVYILMGAACLQRKLNQLRADYQQQRVYQQQQAYQQ